MRFGNEALLWGLLVAGAVAAMLILGWRRGITLRQRFGDEPLVLGLLTHKPSAFRAFKGVLVTLAVALTFIAAARPQYGKGTRLIPATDLDVVLILDYSKSMFARDVAPSRIFRAKVEVARLIEELPGARFAAVAFAGEPMGFPLTADGTAIAQFLRQLDPNDMPVGGTAIARALDHGANLLRRDPRSKDHKRVIVLITDGEDLEGDPVSVAKKIGEEGTRIIVVQIGGRTPEPIPDVSPDGQIRGLRVSADGSPLTTELTAEGETQLASIASSSPGGRIIRAEQGATGIQEVIDELKSQMKAEETERVETVYADVYMYPLGLGVFLLFLELLFPEGPFRRRKLVAGAALASTLLSGCSGWDPKRPFDRWSPEVNHAIEELNKAELDAAEKRLAGYLGTGTCADGSIGLPDRVRQMPFAAYDLGLSHFGLAEKAGTPFGEETVDDAVSPGAPPAAPAGSAGSPPGADAPADPRTTLVECGLIPLRAAGSAPLATVDLKARSLFAAGNLEFLRKQYKSAVGLYDMSLRLAPATMDDNEGLGVSAAHNRAIALRRIEEEEKKKQEQDKNNENKEENQDQKDQDQEPQDNKQEPDPKQEPPKDDPKEPDDKQEPPPAPQPSGSPPPQDRREQEILDQFEEAPTYQEEEAKKRALGRRRKTMEDK